jgi:uncharacterized membrane protein
MSRRSWLVGSLVLSLALNVFLVSVGVTWFNRQASLRVLDPAPMALGYRIADLLPQPQGDLLRDRLRVIEPVIDEQLSEYQNLLAQGGRQLGAAEVDRVALAATIKAARNVRTEVGDHLTDVFVEIAADLPLSARQLLIARVTQR